MLLAEQIPTIPPAHQKTTTSTTTTTTTTTTKRNNAPSYSNTTATTKTTVPKTTACPHRSVSVSVKKYATFSSDGKYSRVCKNCKKTLSTHSAPKLDTVSFKTSYTYSGTALKPTATVKDKYKKAVSSSYYSVTYISRANNKTVSKITSAGQYIAKVKFKGIYSGEKTFYFSAIFTLSLENHKDSRFHPFTCFLHIHLNSAIQPAAASYFDF